MITIFTPSFADASNTNAQNLTVKEVVARLAPERFRVEMLYASAPDERIAGRPNTRLIRWRGRGNSARLLGYCLLRCPDLYFFPREGPLDSAFLWLRRYLRLRTALVAGALSVDAAEGSAGLFDELIDGWHSVFRPFFSAKRFAERTPRK